ncbi:hypothetical protein GGTG_00405 [Gaeumannomyces tritici R3-111a-1]|uniref:Uncharacterized protein n=1 Tax=Gaeumannomyces tritici (strain R3-111a-1) TaxID=644352 RepID=J3NGL6_GAET3|nr:hypothetical protein GGTG_00405 [Gaeumannomyces tritici R3-111a-1]EJT80406.1 hypothetical protein GGTG_00405 [Gaeumannomyces tritici R3-111a-1]
MTKRKPSCEGREDTVQHAKGPRQVTGQEGLVKQKMVQGQQLLPTPFNRAFLGDAVVLRQQQQQQQQQQHRRLQAEAILGQRGRTKGSS